MIDDFSGDGGKELVGKNEWRVGRCSTDEIENICYCFCLCDKIP